MCPRPPVSPPATALGDVVPNRLAEMALYSLTENGPAPLHAEPAHTGADGNRHNAFLWGAGRQGSDILENGIFVHLNRVPSDHPGWANARVRASVPETLRSAGILACASL